jgi:hypothetical protein
LVLRVRLSVRAIVDADGQETGMFEVPAADPEALLEFLAAGEDFSCDVP